MFQEHIIYAKIWNLEKISCDKLHKFLWVDLELSLNFWREMVPKLWNMYGKCVVSCGSSFMRFVCNRKPRIGIFLSNIVRCLYFLRNNNWTEHSKNTENISGKSDSSYKDSTCSRVCLIINNPLKTHIAFLL